MVQLVPNFAPVAAPVPTSEAYIDDDDETCEVADDEDDDEAEKAEDNCDDCNCDCKNEDDASKATLERQKWLLDLGILCCCCCCCCC